MSICLLKPNLYLIAMTLLSVALVLAGCNSGEKNPEEETDTSTATAQNADRARTTTVAVATDSNMESPAASKNTIPSSETTPTQVCQLFVNYLATGNRVMAEQLLTPTAFRVTSNAQLQLEPVAGANAKYELESPRYATNKKKLCHVTCRIKDTIEGEMVESEITWMCRRQKKGWRVAGMLVSMTPDAPKDLLSFESRDDVARIKGSLESDVNAQIMADDAQIREANAGDSNDGTTRFN